jgi:hypothetical protein
MKAELFKNEYPLEDILPDLNKSEVQDYVNNCDYTIDCNIIARSDFPDNPMAKVNTADAIEFYKMGYKAAQERINKVLKPYNND